jgi:hypothetical protein
MNCAPSLVAAATAARSLVAAISLVAASGAAVVPSAHAGEYVVIGCAGQPAPASGWAGSTSGDGARPIVTDGCAGGGPFAASLALGTGSGAGDGNGRGSAASARWRVEAPASTTIAGLNLTRDVTAMNGDGPFGYAARSWLSGGQDPQTIESCVGSSACAPLASSSRLTWRASRSGVAAVDFGVSCGSGDGPACPTGGGIVVAASRSELALDDGAPPQPDAPTGDLVSGPVDPGVHSVRMHATDAGGGVAGIALLVDGAVVANQPTCAPPYRALVPCPPEVTTTESFDPAGLAAGPHSAAVQAVDAGGNVVVSDAVTLLRSATGAGVGAPTASAGGATTTSSAGVGGGAIPGSSASGATSGAGPMHARLTAAVRARGGAQRAVIVSHGGRVILQGRLRTTGGSPIARATLFLSARPIARGVARTYRAVGSVRTRADGAYSVRLEPGVSRSVRVEYRPGTGSTVSARASVDVRVRASAVLRLPSRAQRGKALTITGRVADARFKLVELQARSVGGWQTFATATTDANGLFTYRYSFVRPGPKARYALRVFVPRETGFPYVPAASTERWIDVR